MTTSTLTMLLAGPLQSWGETSRHMTRGTLTYPSKSGVIGLMAAALGRPRGSDVSDLAGLRFAVRTDQPGQLLTDFHTVSGASRAPLDPDGQRLPTAAGGSLRPRESTKVTHRQYLADARFLAAVEGDSELIDQAWNALARPRYPLYLGRRSCPPARPVRESLHPDSTVDAVLTGTPWLAAEHVKRRHKDPEVNLRAVIDDARGSETLNDLPAAQTLSRRSFTARPVFHTTVRIPVPENAAAGDAVAAPGQFMAEHDPFYLLPE